LLNSVLKESVKDFNFKQIMREREQAKRARMLQDLQQKFPKFNKLDSARQLFNPIAQAAQQL